MSNPRPKSNRIQTTLGLLDQTWLNKYLDPPPGHAGLETCSIDPLRSIELFATSSQTKASSLTPDMN